MIKVFRYSKLAVLLATAGIMNGVMAQKVEESITISGRLKGLGNQKVTVTYPKSESHTMMVLAIAENDSFSMRVPVQQEPILARLSTKATPALSRTMPDGKSVGMPLPMLNLFIYRSSLRVTGNTEWSTLCQVYGDAENDGYSHFKQSVAVQEKQNWDLRIKLFYETDTTKVKGMLEESMRNNKAIIALQKQYVAAHPKEFASLYLLTLMPNVYTQQQFEEAFAALDGKYKETKMAAPILKRIASMQATGVGKPAIAFTKKDKDGKTISLSDYKGKLVLLDFWGSWCGPCRASHPHLKELYATYHGKGFEIIAIAQEANKDPEKQRQLWLKAIEEDGLPWIHILNNESADQQNLVKEYAITGFPTKILLDAEGKVLLRVTASATNDIDMMLEYKLGTKK